MADIRINSLPSTATSFNTDDFIAIDGTSGGTRKMSALNPPFSDVRLGGATGPSVKSSLDARAARQGMVFDGTAATTGTLSSTIGTSDFSITSSFTVPASSTGHGIWYLADSTSAWRPYEIALYLTAAGVLQVALRGATINDQRVANVTANLISTYGGKRIETVVTRSSGTLSIYINGISVAYTESTSGTAPAWSVSLPDDKFVVGGFGTGNDRFIGVITNPTIYNRALSASEVVSLFEAGVPSGADYPALKAGTALITGANSDFSSDTGFWTKGSGSVTITGGEAVWTGATYLAATSITPLEKGMQYLLTLNVTQASTNGWSYFNGSGYVSTGITGTGVKTAVLTFVARQTGGFYITNGDGTNGKITDITLTPLGLLLAPDAGQAGGGLTWYDTSGNAANITLPASGVSWNVPSSAKTATGWTFGGAVDVALDQNASTWLRVKNQNTGSGAAAGVLFNNQSGDLGALSLLSSANSPANALFLRTLAATPLVFGIASAENMRLSTSGNLLLGTTTDSSNGKLQLATHTTSAGGIGFGSDLALFRMAQGLFQQDSTGTQVGYRFSKSGTMKGQLVWSGSDTYLDYDGSLFLRAGYGGTTALTLDSSQNATFAGAVKVKNQATLNANGSVSVGTSATTIYSSLNTGSANWAYVFGDNGSHGFADLVVTIGGGNAVTVISSATVYGTPPARTYTSSAANLQLAMASGSMTVRTSTLTPGT